MQIIRYRDEDRQQAAVGILRGGLISRIPGCSRISELLELSAAALREVCDSASGPTGKADYAIRLLAPVDGRTEVWAAGVTYKQSRAARVAESEGWAALYERVYDAERPELFFKAVPWKVRGHQEPIEIRPDSTMDVPEPELALILNSSAEIVGYTICNDVSSRSIEGENPLYLPQAKIYSGSCALGPGITPAWEVGDATNLEIRLVIERDGQVAWAGETNTSLMRRHPSELVQHLFRSDRFPSGVVLSTGTCLVPALPFSLRSGDRVTIGIPELGSLTNAVRTYVQEAAASAELA
jgi:2-dehydro-3-deoxy-D-arabinonate dehydratase